MEGFLAAVGSVWDGVGPVFQEFGGWLSVAALVVWRLVVRAWRWWTRPAPMSPEGQWLLDMLSDPSKCDDGCNRYIARLLPDGRWLMCYVGHDAIETECCICESRNWFHRSEPSTPLMRLLPDKEQQRIHAAVMATANTLVSQSKERHKQDGLQFMREAMQSLGPKDMVVDRPFTVSGQLHYHGDTPKDWVAEASPKIGLDMDMLAEKIAKRLQAVDVAADAKQPEAEPAKEVDVAKWMYPPVGVVVEAQIRPDDIWVRAIWDGVQWSRLPIPSALTQENTPWRWRFIDYGPDITPPNEQEHTPSEVSLPVNCRCTTDPELAPPVVTVSSTSPKTINGKPYPPVGQLVEVLTNMGWRKASWCGTTWQDAIHRCAILTPLDWRMLKA